MEAAFYLLSEMNPQSVTECLLATQMIGVHHSAVSFLKAANSGQTLEVCEALGRQSVRLMRLFNQQLAVLSKLQGKGAQQKVTVEHVHVNAGGQAIVGAVTSGKGTRGGGGNEESKA